MSAPRPSLSRRALSWALVEREYRALDRAVPLSAAITLSLAALTVCVLHAGRAVSPFASPIDLGRRLFQVYFGLSHLAVLVASPLLGAWLAAPERAATRRDLLSLAGVSSGALVRARLVATLGHLGSVVLATSPIAAVSFFYDGVSLRSVLVGVLSLLTCVALGGLLGQAVGAGASSPRAALGRGALAGALTSLGAWHFLGRSLGRALTSSLHLGYHGSSWWPELATHPSLDAAARRTALVAPLVFSIALAFYLFALAARAGSTHPARHTVRVRLAMFATTFAAADLSARLCAHTQHTRVAVATASVSAIAFLAGLSLAMLFVVLGEPLRVAASRASSRRRALERSLGPAALSGVAALLVVTATQMAGLARHATRLINALSEGPPLAVWEPRLVACLALCHLVFAAGLGALLRVLFPRNARSILAATLAALWALPLPLRYILGAQSAPRVARWLLSVSPARTAAWIANFTRSPLISTNLRLIRWRSLPEVILASRVTAAELALGVVAFVVAAWLSRRPRGGR